MMTRFISAADMEMMSFVFEYMASENREANEYMTVVTARRYTITPITATRTTRSWGGKQNNLLCFFDRE